MSPAIHHQCLSAVLKTRGRSLSPTVEVGPFVVAARLDRDVIQSDQARFESIGLGGKDLFW